MGGSLNQRKIILFLLVWLFLAGLAAPGVLEGQATEPMSIMDQLKKGRFGLDKLACQIGLVAKEKCEEIDGLIYVEETTDLRDIVLAVVQNTLGFTSLIALIFIIYGGVTWVTAGGSEERVKKGRDILKWAAIGLAVMVAAWGLVTAVMYFISQVL